MPLILRKYWRVHGGVWAQLPEGGSTNELEIIACPPPVIEEILDSINATTSPDPDRQKKLFEAMVSVTGLLNQNQDTTWWIVMVRAAPDEEPSISRAEVLNRLISEAITEDYSDLQILVLASNVAGESEFDPTARNVSSGASGLIQLIYQERTTDAEIASALGLTEAQYTTDANLRNAALLSLGTGVRLAVRGMKEGYFIGVGGVDVKAPVGLTPDQVDEAKLEEINNSAREFIVQGALDTMYEPYKSILRDFIEQYVNHESGKIECTYFN
ncbi:MAG: lytic transglycosylase domain-containing protein [Synechococcaceae cyanobacterium SM2_3_1]|nr:lytic transglycosylase domain-containing protein [Synechococcaceae cyanobacterium SM2_3_1]